MMAPTPTDQRSIEIRIQHALVSEVNAALEEGLLYQDQCCAVGAGAWSRSTSAGATSSVR
jgi:hypothetical protein